MEHLLLAECEFLSRLQALDLEAGSDDAWELPRFNKGSLDKAIHGCRRGLKEAVHEEEMLVLSLCRIFDCHSFFNVNWENVWCFRDGTKKPWSKCSTSYPTIV